MTVEAWIALGVSVCVFIGSIMVVLGVKSPKDEFAQMGRMLEKLGERVHDIELDLRGSGPLYQDRYERHENTLETLTVALNTLSEKLGTFSKGFDDKLEQLARRVDAIGTRGHI